jgi:hypothetical protein
MSYDAVRKSLPADPCMNELFTTLFTEFDKDVMQQGFIESVRGPRWSGMVRVRALWVCPLCGAQWCHA